MNADNTQPSVFLVGDDDAMRDPICCLLESAKIPCRVFAAAQDFLEFLAQPRCGCVLLDIRMPGMDGMELLESLQEQGIQLQTIAMTGQGNVPLAVRAMKQGAFDVIEKPFKTSELLSRVHAALALIRDSNPGQYDQHSAFAGLTRREREIMELVVAGRSSKDVGIVLGISKKTVDVHRAGIMRKLNVRNVAELVQKRLA